MQVAVTSEDRRVQSVLNQLPAWAKRFDERLRLEGVKASSRRNYLCCLKSFVDVAKELGLPSDPLALSQDQVEAALSILQRRYKPRTFCMQVIALKRLYGVLEGKESDHYRALKIPRKPGLEESVSILTQEEIKRIIAKAGGLRNQVIVEMRMIVAGRIALLTLRRQAPTGIAGLTEDL